MSNALYILLCSGEHEKIQMAGMMASVAAVSERPVEVFVSMNALLAEYWPILLFLGIALGVSGAAVGASLLLARQNPDSEKVSPYECGFEAFEETWDKRAPLGWDVTNPVPAAQACVALLSDWFPATTAEIVHVDGGVHAMGQ